MLIVEIVNLAIEIESRQRGHFGWAADQLPYEPTYAEIIESRA